MFAIHKIMKKKMQAKDRFGKIITKGCRLLVQNIKEPVDVYLMKKELYFSPYNKQELVKSYFSNDLEIIEYEKIYK